MTNDPPQARPGGLRTVYLGTSAFAAAVLGLLNESPYRPVLVLSRPDAPRGRGRKPASPPVAVAARKLALELEQPEDVNDDATRERLAVLRPHALVVCAYGALIREPLLSAQPILNVHPSLLPRWRGAAPIERAILAADRETGVSIMRLAAGLDSGPVGLRYRLTIAPDDDYGSLALKLANAGARLLLQALDACASGAEPRYEEQDESAATYAEKLTAADRRLDLTRPAGALVRQVRALSPHIGAYLERDGGSRLGVWSARVVDGRFEPLIVQPAGKRRMPWADYQRGQRA